MVVPTTEQLQTTTTGITNADRAAHHRQQQNTVMPAIVEYTISLSVRSSSYQEQSNRWLQK
jgi:hypothetical protein